METTDEAEVISENDLVQALLEAFEGAAQRPAGALRTEELVDITGKGVDTIRRTLGKLIGAGQVEWVKIDYTAMNGITTKVRAYRLVATDEDLGDRLEIE